MNERATGSNNIEVFFLPPSTNRRPNRREVELAHAAAKGHIARLIHRKRDEQRFSQPPHQTPSADTSREGGQALSTTIPADNLGPGTNTSESRATGTRDGASTAQTRGTGDEMIRATAVEGTQGPTTLLLPQRPDPWSAPTPFLYNPSAWPVVGPELSTPQTARLLHHALNVLWPGHDLPGAWRIHRPPFSRSWHDFIAPGPGLFHATMYKCALYFEVHKDENSDVTPRDTAFHYQHALQSIRAGISMPLEQISEHTIFAIMIVSLSGSAEEVALSESGPSFDPPFPNLQWVQTYTKIEPQHQEALFRLVELRGGLDALRMNGLQASITNLDIIRSTRSLSKPRLAQAQLFKDFVRQHHRSNSFGLANDLTQELSDDSLRFAQREITDWLRSEQGVSHELIEVLEDMRVWAHVLTTYADESRFAELDLSLLAINRNLLQYRLLSTIEPGESIDTEFQPSIWKSDTAPDGELGAKAPIPDLARLLQTTLLIFSIGVTFPVQNPQVHRILASRVDAMMHAYRPWLFEGIRVDIHALKIAIWVLLLSCMSARHGGDVSCASSLQSILTQLVDEHISRSQSGAAEVAASHSQASWWADWTITKAEILRPVLWHEGACDRIGQAVWRSVLADCRVREAGVATEASVLDTVEG